MNRYRFNSDDRHVPTEDGIEPGQIWRGYLCSANPMLIKIKRHLGNGMWMVEDLYGEHHHDIPLPFEMHSSRIKEIYVIDKWGGV